MTWSFPNNPGVWEHVFRNFLPPVMKLTKQRSSKRISISCITFHQYMYIVCTWSGPLTELSTMLSYRIQLFLLMFAPVKPPVLKFLIRVILKHLSTPIFGHIFTDFFCVCSLSDVGENALRLLHISKLIISSLNPLRKTRNGEFYSFTCWNAWCF